MVCSEVRNVPVLPRKCHLTMNAPPLSLSLSVSVCLLAWGLGPGRKAHRAYRLCPVVWPLPVWDAVLLRVRVSPRLFLVLSLSLSVSLSLSLALLLACLLAGRLGLGTLDRHASDRVRGRRETKVAPDSVLWPSLSFKLEARLSSLSFFRQG